MILGLDTGFLVAAEVVEHPSHLSSRATLGRRLKDGHALALAPQVLAEFIHVVTDPRRFAQPLTVSSAIGVAEKWWTARDVTQVFPCDGAVRQFFAWLQQYSLGRKRLLDTLLAATYRESGITSILTTNPTDFAVYGCFSCVVPSGETLGSS